uniref:CCHC-type domain-containing protein n=1 Tax=Strigamia maritima TaxID=126957 RepID=T1IQ88_STRMM
MMVPEILDKLPAELKYNQDCRPHTPDFESMLNFVSSQLKAYELTEASTAKRIPVQVDQQKRKDPPKAGEKPGTMNTLVNTDNSAENKQSVKSVKEKKCLFCKEGHSPVQCPKVVDADKSYQLVMEKCLCFNCLSAGHSVSKCTSRYKCNICSKRHHTALCRQGSQQPSGQSSKASPPKDVKDLKDINTTVMMTAEAIQFMSFMAIATSP